MGTPHYTTGQEHCLVSTCDYLVVLNILYGNTVVFYLEIHLCLLFFNNREIRLHETMFCHLLSSRILRLMHLYFSDLFITLL